MIFALRAVRAERAGFFHSLFFIEKILLNKFQMKMLALFALFALSLDI